MRETWSMPWTNNLHRLMAVPPDLVDRPDLKFQPFTPGVPTTPVPSEDWFDAIRQSDILLHHPYQSFAPVTEFLRQAATDPHVLTIKQTLYRTGADSAIVQSLVDAAAERSHRKVIELRARFDEEANIELAHDLEEAGAHVVYGVVGLKTHAKMSLVLRREGRLLRSYTHLGTGNITPAMRGSIRISDLTYVMRPSGGMCGPSFNNSPLWDNRDDSNTCSNRRSPCIPPCSNGSPVKPTVPGKANRPISSPR